MLEIRNLTYRYNKQNPLFQHLNLSLKKGCVAGLLGKNGSGKTTLLNIIAGLLFADEGTCQVLGLDSKKRGVNFLKHIYFLPEQGYLPQLTAHAYAKCYAGFYERFDYALFEQCMSDFKLSHNTLLNTFSLGERKKFLLSFGVATRCSLMLLDEPTNGLDIPSKASFRKLLASTITEDQLIIVATHQVADIEHLIDHMIILHENKVVLSQSLLSISHKFAFLFTQEIPNDPSVLYTEKRLGGYLSVCINANSDETDVDIEALFNAVLSNSSQLVTHFQEASS